MIRKIRQVFIIGICVSMGIAAPGFAQGLNIGVMDFQKILENSEAGKAAQAKVNEQGKKMEQELKGYGDEAKNLEEQLEKEALVMSKEVREQKAREVRIKINDLKTLQRKYADDFKRIEARQIQKLQKEVFAVAETIGDQIGYDIILDRRVGGVVFFNPALDITDILIKEYDKVYKNTLSQ